MAIGSLKTYARLMNDASALLIGRLAAAAASGASIDIHAALGDMTMQVVGTSAFGCALCGLLVEVVHLRH